MRILIDGNAVSHSPGDVRVAGHGDRIFVRREAWQRPDWARYWDAIGVALLNGATIRVYD